MKKGYVLQNGVDPSLFHPRLESVSGAVEIAFSGRLIPEKGAHVLVEAMRILSEEGLDAHCTIIGGAGFGHNTSSEYVRQLRSKLAPHTEMAGYLSGAQYAARLRKATLFCCPSIWQEPFGMVIVEAMASGLPVIASATGGIPEILKHGGGVLVEPSNPAVLAAEIKRLVVNREVISRLRGEAVKAVQKYFTWDLIRQHYTQIADEVTKCDDIQKALSPGMLVSC